MSPDEKIEVGDRFETRVSKKAAAVVVERIEERRTPRGRMVRAYVCRNETTGYPCTIKSRRRFHKRLPRTKSPS